MVSAVVHLMHINEASNRLATFHTFGWKQLIGLHLVLVLGMLVGANMHAAPAIWDDGRCSSVCVSTMLCRLIDLETQTCSIVMFWDVTSCTKVLGETVA
jgi:hypothetical protein